MKSPTVLLIDDDPDTICALTDLLEAAGWSVGVAKHGLDALRQLQDGMRPRAMLIDLSMPHMDGRTFCDICDAQPELAAIPRIIVTAQRGASAMRYRARVVVPKPIDHSRLLRALEQELALDGPSG